MSVVERARVAAKMRYRLDAETAELDQEKVIIELGEALLKAVEALEFYAARKHCDIILETLADPTFAYVDHEGDVRVENGDRARGVLDELSR